MASPVAHSFAAFWIFLILAAQSKLRFLAHWRRWVLPLGMLVLVANLPDLDFFASLAFRRNLNEMHRTFSHSFTMAAVTALALGLCWRIAVSYWASVAVYFAAYCSHLLIDLCTGTELGWTNSGSGIPLFWPSATEYSSPFILIIGVQHQDLPAVWSMGNAASSLYELLLCGVITVVVLVIRVRYGQNCYLSATDLKGSKRVRS
jgi:membrane-bound metal-dependent hydrolase YbcI (DUF457 family)